MCGVRRALVGIGPLRDPGGAARRMLPRRRRRRRRSGIDRRSPSTDSGERVDSRGPRRRVDDVDYESEASSTSSVSTTDGDASGRPDGPDLVRLARSSRSSNDRAPTATPATGPAPSTCDSTTASLVSLSAPGLAPVIETGFMPPWPAGGDSPDYQHDWSLSDRGDRDAPGVDRRRRDRSTSPTITSSSPRPTAVCASTTPT